MDLRFARTGVGKSELTWPAHDLSRQARELLGVVDAKRTIDQCLSAVRDARLSDAMMLLTLGLIRPTALRLAAPPGSPVGPFTFPVDELLALPTSSLYTLITRQAKLRLGLIHAFRTILALERCEGAHEQKALAIEFVKEVCRRGNHGDVDELRAAIQAASAASSEGSGEAPVVARDLRDTVTSLPAASKESRVRGLSAASSARASAAD